MPTRRSLKYSSVLRPPMSTSWPFQTSCARDTASTRAGSRGGRPSPWSASTTRWPTCRLTKCIATHLEYSGCPQTVPPLAVTDENRIGMRAGHPGRDRKARRLLIAVLPPCRAPTEALTEHTERLGRFTRLRFRTSHRGAGPARPGACQRRRGPARSKGPGPRAIAVADGARNLDPRDPLSRSGRSDPDGAPGPIFGLPCPQQDVVQAQPGQGRAAARRRTSATASSSFDQPSLVLERSSWMAPQADSSALSRLIV